MRLCGPVCGTSRAASDTSTTASPFSTPSLKSSKKSSFTVSSCAVSWDQDQLPGRLPRFEVAMGVRRLGQRKCLADVQREPAVAHEGEAALGALPRLVGKVSGHRR